MGTYVKAMQSDVTSLPNQEPNCRYKHIGHVKGKKSGVSQIYNIWRTGVTIPVGGLRVASSEILMA